MTNHMVHMEVLGVPQAMRDARSRAEGEGRLAEYEGALARLQQRRREEAEKQKAEKQRAEKEKAEQEKVKLAQAKKGKAKATGAGLGSGALFGASVATAPSLFEAPKPTAPSLFGAPRPTSASLFDAGPSKSSSLTPPSSATPAGSSAPVPGEPTKPHKGLMSSMGAGKIIKEIIEKGDAEFNARIREETAKVKAVADARGLDIVGLSSQTHPIHDKYTTVKDDGQSNRVSAGTTSSVLDASSGTVAPAPNQVEILQRRIAELEGQWQRQAFPPPPQPQTQSQPAVVYNSAGQQITLPSKPGTAGQGADGTPIVQPPTGPRTDNFVMPLPPTEPRAHRVRKRQMEEEEAERDARKRPKLQGQIPPPRSGTATVPPTGVNTQPVPHNGRLSAERNRGGQVDPGSHAYGQPQNSHAEYGAGQSSQGWEGQSEQPPQYPPPQYHRARGGRHGNGRRNRGRR